MAFFKIGDLCKDGRHMNNKRVTNGGNVKVTTVSASSRLN